MNIPQEFELVQVHKKGVPSAEVIIRDKFSFEAYGGNLQKYKNPKEVYPPDYFKEQNEPIKIFENPLSDEEFKQHSVEGLIRKMSSRYHLIDIIKSLKFGRPNTQIMDEWIAMLELKPERGNPFGSDIVNGVWEK